MLSLQHTPPGAAWAHPLPEAIPSLRDVAAALRRVKRCPEPGPGFRIGICDDAGTVRAGAMVASFVQVQRLALAMGDLGYADVIAGEADEMQGCHVLFMPRSHAGAR
ncbi:hypothetical protein [Ramlibacter alkalitolerans]|jgi:hypothetical protein|uniref:Uncharacterized protein n=1 Tax=Ramlibacter alkalitolerans TaxID=2039631 RepID=A0ABS1JQU7_9BURK|nr:hypothetical protein [Ramlibacter alkalitolerans]MBL0426650.1 hypothetical protein [Ramlibacter alkalitolerans]